MAAGYGGTIADHATPAGESVTTGRDLALAAGACGMAGYALLLVIGHTEEATGHTHADAAAPLTR